MLNLKKLKKKVTFYTLAKAMNIPLSTIYSWKNSIPKWRINDIIAACEKMGVDISDCLEGEA